MKVTFVKASLVTLILSGTALAQQGPVMPATPGRPGGLAPIWENPGKLKEQAAPQGTPTVSQKHAQPQAKSKEEFAAFQTAAAPTPDLAAALKAADDFSQKYPQSDLRYVLYAQLLQKANAASQTPIVIDAGRKLLAIEPQDAMALIIVSTALAESTHDTDLDQDEKYAEAMKDAESGIKGIDTGLVVSPQVPAEQVAAAKRQLVSMGNATMGYVELNRKNYGLSEKYLKDAIAANPDQPDSTNFLRLAVAQDKQDHYTDAIVSVDKALQLAQAENNDAIVSIAKNEKDRLTKLAATPKKQ
jgi:hypothetical protein